MKKVDATGLYKTLGYSTVKQRRVESAAQVLSFLVELKKRMADKCISQTELACKIGVSNSKISGWLSGERKLTAKDMFLLARGIGCEINLRWEGRDT